MDARDVGLLLLALCVAFSHAAVRHEKRQEPDADLVWLLSHNYTSYAFSRLRYSLIAMRPGGLEIDELSLTTKAIIKTFTLPITGYRLTIGHTGIYVTVVHNSYMTFINLDSQLMQTENFPYADVPVNGLVADLTAEHESCGWMHLAQSGQYVSEIVCVNPTNGNSTKCYDQGGTYGYAVTTLGSADGKYIYGLTSSGYVIKYYVPDVTPSPIALPRCPLYQYYRLPNWGAFYTPHSAWFSYDNSRIFFNNGLTLTASENRQEDLVEHGSFNGSFSSEYLYWVDQDAVGSAHTVIALRRIYESTVGNTMIISRYSWPYLEGLQASNEVPVPTTPSGLKVSTDAYGAQVYFGRTASSMIAIVNYTTANNAIYAPGVAFITS